MPMPSKPVVSSAYVSGSGTMVCANVRLSIAGNKKVSAGCTALTENELIFRLRDTTPKKLDGAGARSVVDRAPDASV